jgi:hypothetical protein
VRTLTLPLAVLLSAVLAFGCGAEDAAEKLDPVAEAADKTLAAGGAKVTGGGDFESQGVTVKMVIDGEVDFEESAFAFEMDFGKIPGLSAKEVQQVREESGMPVEYVMRGDEVFVSSDFLKATAEGKAPDIDEEWIKIDVGELSEDALPGVERIAGANETNPAEMLRFLKVVGDAKKVGEERVGGVPTTEYRAHIDLRKAVELAPEDEREEFRETIDRVAKAQGGYEMGAQVFIDRDGLIRRERFTFDDEVDGEEVAGALTMEFHDFGRDVSIEEPDDVRDITDEVENALG